LIFGLPLSYAQKKDKIANSHSYADSLKEAHRLQTDSIKEARNLANAKMKINRKHFTDSLNAIHAYKNSSHYKDSVLKKRNAHFAKIQKDRKHLTDSLRKQKQESIRQVNGIRKLALDSVHKIQKHRSDSLAVIRRYKQSKRYVDSVSIVRHVRMDSIHVVRKKFNDSMLKYRKKQKEILTKERKHITDSIKIVRTKYVDSIKAIRKARADSLAKVKADKQKALLAAQKQRELKLNMAMELKIKQKHEKWSNESMLKKKWIPPRSLFQNTITRYNYYYNANKKMDEALANMQRARKDNFDSLIGIYPFDPNRDSSMLSADMDSIIHKISVGIQVHDPRSKWADDLYLLLGEAYYYKGNYNNAAIAFRYIIALDEQKKKEQAIAQAKPEGVSIVQDEKKSKLDFLKHQPVHNDAILWLSRTFTESRQIENAESILSLIDSDPSLPQTMVGKIALEKAFLRMMDHNYTEAAKQLAIVVKDDNIPEWIRARCAYINGQILQHDANYLASSESFKNVIDLNPKIEMEFYARKNIAYNSMFGKSNMDETIASLKKVLNDGKYIPYHDQVYFILGQLAANNNNNEDAIDYLQKSIDVPRGAKKQKAISFAALGNIYFYNGNYLLAKSYYDSATKYASSATKDTLVIAAIKRAKVLGDVSGPLNVIHVQDSLLALANMTEKEQNAVARKYLRYLEKLRQDSIFKAENAPPVVAATANTFDNPDAGNWYFGNQALMQQGFNDFKRKWGNRPLADNWRRASAINNNNVIATDSVQSPEEMPELDENGLPTIESLLAAIPDSDERLEAARKKIQKALIDLSDAYVRKLEDMKLAKNTLDTLDSRYPNHGFKVEDAYLRYLIAIKQGKLDEAIAFSGQIQQNYPDSKYATLVKPTEDKAGRVDTGVSVSNFYDQTYAQLIVYQYTDVLARVREAQKIYKDPVYLKRFRIMEAIAMAGSGNYKQADTLLKEFTKVNPSDSLKFWAEAIIKFLSKKPAMPLAGSQTGPLKSHWPYYGDPLGKPSDINDFDKDLQTIAQKQASGAKDTVFASTQAEDKAIKATTPLPAVINYSYTPTVEHYAGIVLPGMEYRLAKLRNAIKAAQTSQQTDQLVYVDLLNPEQSILLIKGFPDLQASMNYLTYLAENNNLFDEYKPNEYQFFVISANDYKILMFKRNIGEYLDFYSHNFK